MSSETPRGSRLDLNQFKGFTPGPWMARRSQSAAKSVTVKTKNPDRTNTIFVVAEAVRYDRDMSPTAQNSNAALIAAAPDLLAECKRQREEIERLREAISGLLANLTGRAAGAAKAGDFDKSRFWASAADIARAALGVQG